MKPRTKLEYKVVAANGQLQPIGQEPVDWAFKHCVEHRSCPNYIVGTRPYLCFRVTALFRKPQRFFSVYRIYFSSDCTILQAQRFLSTSTYWLSRFLSKAHPVAPYNIQGLYNSLSSVFRLRLIEAITLPFHRQKSKYSLSISLSPRSIFCNNRLLRNFLLSPSTLYGPTL